MSKIINDGQQLTDDVERMIDKMGLALFLSTVAQVCYLKADHIRENWQDESLAKAWNHVGVRVDGIADLRLVETL